MKPTRAKPARCIVKIAPPMQRYGVLRRRGYAPRAARGPARSAPPCWSISLRSLTTARSSSSCALTLRQAPIDLARAVRAGLDRERDVLGLGRRRLERDLGQLHRDRLDDDRNGDEEDDEEHQHDVDERRRVDVRHRANCLRRAPHSWPWVQILSCFISAGAWSGRRPAGCAAGRAPRPAQSDQAFGFGAIAAEPVFSGGVGAARRPMRPASARRPRPCSRADRSRRRISCSATTLLRRISQL